jgi:hypothetical protein
LAKSSCQGFFSGGEFSNCDDPISFWEFFKRVNLKIIAKNFGIFLQNFQNHEIEEKNPASYG